jgi:cell division protein FtsW
MILTALTFFSIFARRIHGASRWISLGGIAFQPSEFLKMALILYASYILSKKDWAQASFIRDYIPLLLIISIPCALILAQPDFGLTVTLALTIFLMFFLASFRLQHLMTSLLVLVPAAISLMLLKPYRLKRILVFLNPWEDPLGSGFQIIQSLIAVGSGHLVGLGIGNSHQKFFYLPMQHTDFIFSVIAEEIGFLGTTSIIGLYILLLYYGLRISLHINDKFSSLVIAGFSMVTSLQAIINIAVTTGLVPTKGIGLPFVSYGNTSLVCNLLMVGIVINLVREYA